MRNFTLTIIALLFSLNFVYADTLNNQEYVGTPPGFYDDIDPNSLNDDEDDNKALQLYNRNTEQFTQKNIKTSEYTDFDDDNSDFGDYITTDNTPPTKNYAEIYNQLELADFSYLHNIDPEQYYDSEKSAWSIYPLLRLNSPIYFKNLVIEPGYYLLTPREHNGKWYMLFKQNGLVMYIIPVYERGYTPETFYDAHIPKPKLTKSQKVHMKILDTVGKVKSSKRQEPVKSYLEVNDLDNYFVSIIIYYGGHKYSTLFRTIRL